MIEIDIDDLMTQNKIEKMFDELDKLMPNERRAALQGMESKEVLIVGEGTPRVNECLKSLERDGVILVLDSTKYMEESKKIATHAYESILYNLAPEAHELLGRGHRRTKKTPLRDIPDPKIQTKAEEKRQRKRERNLVCLKKQLR